MQNAVFFILIEVIRFGVFSQCAGRWSFGNPHDGFLTATKQVASYVGNFPLISLLYKYDILMWYLQFYIRAFAFAFCVGASLISMKNKTK